ncbi:hypothetical protein CRG98_013694 [Punica granatum]|uniref:DUF7745 domain-containing protein n=1 Tax=Punica granatum TaxID=22663 RepID=A0A2I0KCU2_PUNGR|nr:hypothetical protein CRG98_013694 [Punica granatum]
MDRPAPGLRLEAIMPPRQDIMRIWRTFRPVDHAFIRGIIGGMVMFAETTVDWIFLRTAAEFWDPEHASQLSTLLRIPAQDIHEELYQRWDQGIRIAWLSDWMLLRAMTPTTASYQGDAYHGFLLLVFGTLLFPYSPNLIDGAVAQVVLQAVGGHSYVEALLAETVRSLDYVREERPLRGPHRRPPPPTTKPASRHSREQSTKWPPAWQSCSPYSRDPTEPLRAPRLHQDRSRRLIQPRGLHQLKPRRTCRRPLFPGMRLPPKFKITEFKNYEGTTDPRHHLRHYRGKMQQYWEYEEFVIHSFQDSLSGSALDWFMSLKAEDIPTWEDLSRKFTDQYRYCAETPPTLLELSTKEMA